MVKTRVEGVWYPGELAPHMFYLDSELVGMAAAIPRRIGQVQKWVAFDMRFRNDSDTGPLLLGEHKTLELAKQQVEKTLVGAPS